MSVKNNKVRNTLNLMRHSERSEESMDPSVGVASLKDDNRAGQRGRSMVEMLGVLAIAGVLSVGGVYGYGVAMKKHKANELLHQASIHAATVSAQIASGKTTLTLDNFGNASYGTFNSNVEKTNDEQFTLTVENVDESVCNQLKAGGIVRNVSCGTVNSDGETTATLRFNNNLSTEKVAADYNSDQTGASCTEGGYNWCSGLTTPSCKKDCCSGITLNDCQENCDSSTGEITNKEDGTDCTTTDGKEATCNGGVCEEQINNKCDEICLFPEDGAFAGFTCSLVEDSCVTSPSGGGALCPDGNWKMMWCDTSSLENVSICVYEPTEKELVTCPDSSNYYKYSDFGEYKNCTSSYNGICSPAPGVPLPGPTVPNN